MTLYHNKNPDALIHTLELSPGEGGGTYAFFHLKNGVDKSQLKAWLASPEAGQEVLAETRIDGHTLLVTRGASSAETMLQKMSQRGETFALPVVEKKFKPWVWRGITSIVGQSLQLVSSITTSKSGSDRAAIAGFAISNMIANITNITFGSQKKDDPHQLRAVKKHINDEFGKFLPDGESAISPDQDRLALRPEEKDEKSLGKKTHAFIKKYSVTGGEIGLRLFGATSLAFPITKWGKGFSKLKSGSLKEAINVAKNENRYTYIAGLLTLAGKFISLGSSEPDPYHPDPPGMLDKIRENVTFRLSSVVEAVGAYVMMHDRFAHQKLNFRGKEYPDYFGGVGNAVFIAGYVIRFFAPYGSLEVDSKELHAHITDTLAKMPREKVPQFLAEIAVDLKEHFRGKAPNIATIYSQLAAELKQYHHIALEPVPAASEPAKKQIASAPTASRKAAETPAARYQDKISASSEPALGIPG